MNETDDEIGETWRWRWKEEGKLYSKEAEGEVKEALETGGGGQREEERRRNAGRK